MEKVEALLHINPSCRVELIKILRYIDCHFFQKALMNMSDLGIYGLFLERAEAMVVMYPNIKDRREDLPIMKKMIRSRYGEAIELEGLRTLCILSILIMEISVELVDFLAMWVTKIDENMSAGMRYPPISWMEFELDVHMKDITNLMSTNEVLTYF